MKALNILQRNTVILPIITIKPSIKCQSMLKMENSVLFRRQNTKFVQKPYEIKILHFVFLF